MLSIILTVYVVLITFAAAYIHFRLRRPYAPWLLMFALVCVFVTWWLAGQAGWR